MMKLVLGISIAAVLSACGADGYPTSSSDESPLSLSGESRMGVVTGEGFITETDLTINFGL